MNGLRRAGGVLTMGGVGGAFVAAYDFSNNTAVNRERVLGENIVTCYLLGSIGIALLMAALPDTTEIQAPGTEPPTPADSPRSASGISGGRNFIS